MSGIVRQNEQYGIFEDRPRGERVAREAPAAIVAEYSRQRPSVSGGLLNPRGIRRQHFAGWENDYGRPGPLEPPEAFGDDPTELREREEEHRERFPHLYDDEPPDEDDPYGGQAPETPLIPLHQMLEEHNRPLPPEPPEHFGSRLGFNRLADGEGGGMAAAPMMTTMFWQGNRVGIPYGDSTINGTVTHVQPDGQVGVLYDDGQFMPESPGDIHHLY